MNARAIIEAVTRHLITKGAGVLLAHGTIKESEAEQITAAVIFLVGIAWSIFEKRAKQRAQAPEQPIE